MLTDIEIAQNANIQNIATVAERAGIPAKHLELYGNYKAKISPEFIESISSNKSGHLVLVTAVNPTPAGEGKTTITIGLGQAMNAIGKNTIIAIREPSLGPVMGIKGGAAGGGYSQVIPMEDINLHFTGDMHAITAANNLLSATIDNHIHHGNPLNIDSRQIFWKRAMDMNDRALRNIVVGLGGKINGFPREDSFVISVASEIMAILCLSDNLIDLKNRLGKIIIAYDMKGNPVFVNDLKIAGAMCLLLKDAIKPNLIQTLENTPALMHGGPFANIAHGCNSSIATKLALKISDYTITEAGFGADLGAGKFFDIKCRYAGLPPSAAVLVATIRALKYNGGADKTKLSLENLSCLKSGMANLEKHIENIRKFGIPVIVAINNFHTDTDREKQIIMEKCQSLSVDISFTDVFSKGSSGGIELANKLVKLIDNSTPDFKLLYDINEPIKNKIEKIATKIYGAKSVIYSKKATNQINKLESLSMDKLPICIAKTQYSLSDNPQLLGRPENFNISVKELSLSNGAGFIVVLTGDIMTMPGLPKTPSAENIDINEEGIITGLF